jgi:hypothetical protein
MNSLRVPSNGGRSTVSSGATHAAFTDVTAPAASSMKTRTFDASSPVRFSTLWRVVSTHSGRYPSRISARTPRTRPADAAAIETTHATASHHSMAGAYRADRMTAHYLLAAALLLLALDFGDGVFHWWPVALVLACGAVAVAMFSPTTAGGDSIPSEADVPSVASPAVPTRDGVLR